MALDPSSFYLHNITDTCSVWNILSSKQLYLAATNAKVHFCITSMVLYECLYKPRSSITTEEGEIVNRLKKARNQEKFPVVECDLNDLALIASKAPKKLGSGELSCIAATHQIRSVSFMTDDWKARQFAENNLKLNVQTTPKLYAWLHFHLYLSDSDHRPIIEEHERFERRPLTPFLEEAYQEAARCRLMSILGR
jgi:predicted nucleic acid-binding protein